MKGLHDDDRKAKNTGVALGMSFGLIAGAGLGVTVGNAFFGVGLGGAIGLCLGLIAGAVFDRRRNKDDTAEDVKDGEMPAHGAEADRQ